MVLIFGMGLFFAGQVQAQWTEGAGVLWTNDNVGIGLSNPGQKLDVDGNISLGVAGSIFAKRQDNTMHEFFSMDTNNDILINRSSIIDGLPSRIIMGIGQNERFQIRDSENKNLMSIWEASGRVEVHESFLIGVGGRMSIRRSDGAMHEMFSLDTNDDIVINRGSLVAGLPSSIIFGLGENKYWDVKDSDNAFLLRLEESTKHLKLWTDMFVDGKITATEIEVKLDVWPDFVFSPDYKLKSLGELEDYIKENKSLPGVPTEEYVIENGVNVGEMTSILLQKIEELTLHVIELNKQNEELSRKVSEMKN